MGRVPEKGDGRPEPPGPEAALIPGVAATPGAAQMCSPGAVRLRKVQADRLAGRGVDPLREAQRYFGERVADYRASATHANAEELARMLAWLAPRRGGRALDVATGGGHTARALAASGLEVVATDATRGMLAGLAWPGVVADAQRMPFRSAAFDVVASRIAPHHFRDLGAFVREAARVLRPGGALYVFDLTSPEDAEAAAFVDRIERLRDPSHVWSHAPGAWRRALAAAGLDVERLETTASEFALEPWLARARMTPTAEAEVRRLLAERPAARTGGYGLTATGAMRVLRVELLARRPSGR